MTQQQQPQGDFLYSKLDKAKIISLKHLSKEQRQQIKSEVLQDNLTSKLSQLSLLEYRLSNRDLYGIHYPTLDNKDWDTYDMLLKAITNNYSLEQIKIALQLNNNHYKRTRRLKERIREAVESGKAYFITITFNNDTLDKTSQKTRRIYISRWLKSLSPFYVANIDYGGLNGREHYHAVLTSDTEPAKTWEYGFIDIKKVRTTENDTKRISKYISKLTNHAIKETAKQNYMIYSRNNKSNKK